MPCFVHLKAKLRFFLTNNASTEKAMPRSINVCKLQVYEQNAIRIQYAHDDTLGAAQSPEQLYLLWDFPGKETADRTYLLGYIGAMGHVIKTIRAELEPDNKRSNEGAENLFQTYLTPTDMHMQAFHPNKAFYYQLPASLDKGYWHDSAARLLQDIESPQSPNESDKLRLEQFIHAIAKRVFLIPFDFVQRRFVFSMIKIITKVL
jgi:hypothetical protein